jgi:hypothetical protein
LRPEAEAFKVQSRSRSGRVAKKAAAPGERTVPIGTGTSRIQRNFLGLSAENGPKSLGKRVDAGGHGGLLAGKSLVDNTGRIGKHNPSATA